MSKRSKQPKQYNSDKVAIRQDEANDSIEVAGHSYSGPVPPPELMMQYAQIDPSFPDRLLRMTESQMTHQQKEQRFALRADAAIAFLGVFSAFTVSMSVIYWGAQVALAGSTAQSIAGVLLSGTGLAGLVGTFIYGTRNTKHSHKEQDK